MRILSVVGARPNFMKLAPVDRELVRRGVEHVIVHTGQHYDPGMSDAFFEQLWLPAPDHDLGVGAGSHAQQTGAVMQRLEPVVVEGRPDLVLTYGDVNSPVAAALVAAKLQLRVRALASRNCGCGPELSGASGCSSRSGTWTCSVWSPTPASWSRTRADSRRKPRSSVCRASPCERIPSARSRARTAPTGWCSHSATPSSPRPSADSRGARQPDP